MGAGGSTAGAAGDEDVEFRPRRQRYAGPGTQPVPPGHLRVRVPPGLGPGRRLNVAYTPRAAQLAPDAFG